MLQDKNSREMDLNKYRDSSGLSIKKLNLGLWMAENRRWFFFGFIILMIVISLSLWGYSTFSFLKYYFKDRLTNKDALNSLVQSRLDENIRLRSSAGKLEEFPPQIFFSSGKYDFLGKLSNPNNNFSISFSYCFTDGKTDLSCSPGFILPEETKYLLSLGNTLKNSPSNLKMELRDVMWNRVNLHQFPNWKQFAESHLNFSVTDVSIKTAEASGISDKTSLSILEFNVTNNTAYSYWEVPLNIILNNGSSAFGVSRYTLDEFRTGQKRSVKIVLSEKLGADTKAIIIPEINLNRDDIYMKIE